MNQTHLDNRNGYIHPEEQVSASISTVEQRTVRLGTSYSECSNEVRTSKYTVLTWAPKSLLWQFRRVANIYFLLISILTAMPFSPKNPLSMIGTFSFVLVFTMLKEAYEDYFRHQQDKTVNRRPVTVLQNGALVTAQCKDLQVGQFVRVKENEFIPADLLLLASSHAKGVAFVNTMNLDGETNGNGNGAPQPGP